MIARWLPALASVALATAATYPAAGATSPTQWQGRYILQPGGAATFDWPGTRVRFTVSGTTAVQLVLSAPGTCVGHLRVYVDNVAVNTLVVNASSSMWSAVTGLSADATHVVEIYNLIEPALLHPQPFLPSPPYQALTLAAITVDGTIVAPPPQLQRTLVIVGDSISAGFGAGLEAADCGPDNSIYHEDNANTYGNLLCRNFSANCSIIAWSGKGLYVNSPTAGTSEVMPSYYTQTTGAASAPYTADWDFSRSKPDAVIINLGTNDYGHNHDTGPAWEANFTRAYVNFMHNLTVWHAAPQLPIFCAVGPLTSKPTPQVNAAIAAFNAAGGNAHFLDQHTSLGGDGCNGHPGPRGHAAMFEASRPVIAAVMGW